MGSQNNEEQEMHKMVKRRYFTQSTFDLLNDYDDQKPTVSQRLGSRMKKCFTPSCACFKKALLSFFPFIGIMQKYRIRSDLLPDIVAGLTVGVMHIPQGMAYGMLANIDPVYGLYTSFFPVILYFFLGTSRHISIGTFAVVSIMLGTVVDKSDCFYTNSDKGNVSFVGYDDMFPLRNHSYEENSTHWSNATSMNDGGQSALDAERELCKVGYVMATTLIAGIYQLLMGLLRVGFVTIYLSDALTRALTTGAAVHVFVSQMKHVFGISVGRFNGPLKLVYTFYDIFLRITTTNVASLIMSVICIILIYAAKRWLNPLVKKKLKIPLPAELIVLVICTVISTFAKFSSRDVFKMKVVGNIPTGFPAPSLPPANRLQSVAIDSIGIAIVSFTISISMAKIFCKKHGYSVDSNQELLAFGVTNILSSMVSSYVGTASLSRSVLQESVGGRTQVTGLVSCSLLLVVLLALAPLFRDLPNCVLAAIIIVNLKGVFLQIKDVPELLKISIIDTMIWIVTFMAVVLTDVDMGLLIGVAFSLLTVVFRTQRVHTSLLGRIPHTEVYADVKNYPSANEVQGIKVFRFGASLCYTNADNFLDKLYKKTSWNPVKMKAAQNSASTSQSSKDDHAAAQPMKLIGPDDVNGDAESHYHRVTRPAHLIIDCTAMVFIDSAGIATLKQVVADYAAVGIQVSFARCCKDLYEILKTTVCTKVEVDKVLVERAKIFLSVHDAVTAALDNDPTIQSQFNNDKGSGGVVNGMNGIGNTAGDQVNGEPAHESFKASENSTTSILV